MTLISGPLALRGRRAERFADLLDDETGTARTDEAVLVDLVAELRAVPSAPAPAAAYTADLRERLMAAADEALVPDDPRLVLAHAGPTGRVRRRMTVAAAAAVLVGSTGGIAVAAQSAVIGDPLYGVKRGIEAVSTSMSLSEASRGEDYLSQSQTRLAEVSTLLQGDSGSAPTQEAVRATLERFSASAGKGSDLLLASYQRDASPDHVAAVRSFAGSAMSELDEAAAQAPAGLEDAFSEAASTLTDIDQQARVLCAACGQREPLELTTALEPASSTTSLNRLIEAEAAQTPARTPARGQAPSSAKPSAPRATTSPSTGSSPSTLSGTVDSVTGGTSTGTTSKSSGGKLVKLPGSQSGAPSVIDLDKVTKDLGSTVTTTTDGLSKALGGS